ncbi:uncharacterized protein B0H18DRAFT_1082284 [Fomitopsis serialis]|uniref:uncharacterized protein n=1 Tax=Fomitopsis serialis TaxID=139415 RepID=UPI002007D53B|nr:uncharacterized protein B0H18DRAFT_1082284 [Neoantrodia serialis]KAH9935534.1 hypothetical protein B0H18DRAFT_1082284 [Neoantrodia serialis]
MTRARKASSAEQLQFAPGYLLVHVVPAMFVRFCQDCEKLDVRSREHLTPAPGTLELTNSHLQWTQDGKKAPSVRVVHAEAASLFSSKEGAPQVRLKVGLVSDDAGHNFTFTSPQPTALAEREKFKSELTTSSVTPGTPATPTPANAAKAKLPQNATMSHSRAGSVDSRGSGTPVGSDPTHDYRLRKKVLLGNPELAALHRELVMGGHISENEFWEGREHLILALAAAESQKRGKPGQLVDPRPQTVDGEEYPVVAKAYSDTVPNKLTEAEFWKRYFQSKLFNVHRASIRSSAAQHVVKDDAIFDKYLEKGDDELEPRRLREEGVDIFIDLGATSVDHDETGNVKDVTMQPGKQRAVLPLIRKFNEHSGRLLHTALGEPAAKRRRVDEGADHHSQLDLEDLHDNQSSAGIILDMQDRQRYFESRALDSASLDASLGRQRVDPTAALQGVQDSLEGWSENLRHLKLENKAGDAALIAMTKNVSARLEVKMRKHDIPDGLFRQLTTCQTAANEFLRQFWLSIYPPVAEGQIVSAATPAQKAAKAAKMIGYLSRTHEKVEALVGVARQEGVDPGRVQVAMKPMLDAVDKALAFWQARSAKDRAPR